jgi:putative MFS transporter
MGTASAVARLGGILRRRCWGLPSRKGFGFAIGVFAALLVLAALALLLVRTETRDRAILPL